MSEETRHPMWCDSCRQSDTDPRHHVLQADGSVQTMHMDCCRETDSCIDNHCHKLLTASGEKRKAALLKWIKENPVPTSTGAVILKKGE